MSFSDQLLNKYQNLFTKATTHQFTTELCQGTLPDNKLLLYLIQDLKFFQVGIRLTCKLASLCDDDESQIKLAKQIGFFANNENDYFQICIKDLSSKVALDQSILLPQVETYVAYLKNLLKSNNYSYGQLVTAHYLMEEVYLKWANDAIENNTIPSDIEWKHKEWIDLHSGEGFSNWVKFLKDEVDRVGDETCEQIFVDMCKLEFEFFDACYKHLE
ncbi:Seed maturation protein PM36 [Wickerhamomyces ciferrii]|uniref:Seed maturation protein PM36 n=1 Tax=Wickerhamomyces ciferrii (strain ATCC 14091 / BCRC 22168 / CBS 111 / JCM 3599 / NBRC 0793 / NRRL Y-1031 F-60-10) TaxID=1206466 RepID=K0KKE7_WICCF|nr:Seed maturation protein PM36 [Wickerhamomyces ciferrii]CCH41593.1 Seed maturation protein PM36 [Wickerhamomyces ciferrii]